MLIKSSFLINLPALLAGLFFTACSKSETVNPVAGNGGGIIIVSRPASIGYVGDTTDVVKAVSGGVVLMGGGSDVSSAFRWMIDRSGGGNVVIIRASGTDAYNPYVFQLGKVASVETLKIDSRDLADNKDVARIIRNAEMLFIAGGDQSDYMRYWKGTQTEAAINYLLNDKKAPVGGTSAGCAILGSIYYSGEKGSVVSAEALSDPYDERVTLYKDDFLHPPFLDKVITDQHYLTRNREGRHMAFLARIIKDKNVFPKGIAADEKTAVCIDKDGKAKVFGSGKAYFLISNAANVPERCTAGSTLDWVNGNQAVKVYEITASDAGAGYFSVADFDPSLAAGGAWYWWWVQNGVLKKAGA